MLRVIVRCMQKNAVNFDLVLKMFRALVSLAIKPVRRFLLFNFTVECNSSLQVIMLKQFLTRIVLALTFSIHF